MLRLFSYVAFACAVFILTAVPAIAADEVWTVTEVAGGATVVAPMGKRHQVVKGETFAPGATLTTAKDGKVVFGDGKTTITVSPSSRLTMPADPSDVMTRFMQDLGSVFFKVEKRPMQHFEVETPLIAAVVKGTQFTVVADSVEHSVTVTEGLVEVVAMHGGMKEMVPAGRSAHVRVDDPVKLKLAGETATHASNGVITRAIGDEPIDYAGVTGGLVTATPMTGLVLNSGGGGSSGSHEAAGAASGGSLVAVGVGTGANGGVVADVALGSGNGGGLGVSVGLDAGAGAGGSGGVGVGVDLGASAGGGSVSAGVDVGVGSGSSGGVTVGAGVDVGSGSGGVSAGVSAGAGSGGVNVGAGVGTGSGTSVTAGVSAGSGGANVGVGVGTGGVTVGVGSGGINIGVGTGSSGGSNIHLPILGGGPHG